MNVLQPAKRPKKPDGEEGFEFVVRLQKSKSPKEVAELRRFNSDSEGEPRVPVTIPA
jgi:hypothetical protein